MTPPPALQYRHAFGGIDWFMLVAYAGAVLGVGFYYARRQKTTEEYFMGGRSTHPFLAGISYFTAATSIITYIGTPGEFVQYGPGLVFWAALPALPIVQWLVGSYIIPAITRLPITSAYELLESRLGMNVRKLGSVSYMLMRFIWMAMILFTCSKVMVRVTGCDPHWAYLFAILTGAITTTYTLFGGLKAVMITEVIQFFMLVLGALLTLVLITMRLGGFSAWWPTHWEAHWPAQPVFGHDLHIRAILSVALLYNVIAYVATAGSDQSAIQRLLSTRDAPAARRAYLLNNIANAGTTILLGLVGAALIAFYRANPQSAPGMTMSANGDDFFPYFISHEMPKGISGLVVASLLAMAMSCLSAGINALTTIISKDFIDTRVDRPKPSQKAEIWHDALVRGDHRDRGRARQPGGRLRLRQHLRGRGQDGEPAHLPPVRHVLPRALRQILHAVRRHDGRRLQRLRRHPGRLLGRADRPAGAELQLDRADLLRRQPRGRLPLQPAAHPRAEQAGDPRRLYRRQPGPPGRADRAPRHQLPVGGGSRKSLGVKVGLRR